MHKKTWKTQQNVNCFYLSGAIMGGFFYFFILSKSFASTQAFEIQKKYYLKCFKKPHFSCYSLSSLTFTSPKPPPQGPWEVPSMKRHLLCPTWGTLT